MRHTFSLENNVIEENIRTFSNYLKENKIEAAYISSFDIFMNEYVPMQECHRYYFTGFTGSVAEVLMLATGKCYLFVDGRYHEQADIEVKASGVEVVKCPYGQSLFAALVDKIKETELNSLWINGDRTSLGAYNTFKELVPNIVSETDSKISELVELSSFENSATLETIHNVTASSDKVKRFLDDEEGFWVSALDSISWVTNLRGYGLPFQSSFMARCLVTNKKISLGVPHNYSFSAVEDNVEVSKTDLKSFSNDVDTSSIKKIYFDPNLINVSDYLNLEKKIGSNSLIEKSLGITKLHAMKTEDELKLMDEAFLSGDKAISNTINWAKESFHKGEKISEKDIFLKTTHFYELEGSKSKSFGTISGLGANSSIIHYSNPSEEVYAEDGMILLLDSGGYFEGGFATDTTRTIFLGKGEPTSKQKLIYTLVLKGLLQAQNAVFPKGTWGTHIDALARGPILNGGFNYAHGTGHGVGINVHEGGLRFSPSSSIPLDVGNVGSIEPGIYLPGFGGVRLENIVTVVEHPEYKDLLCFRPLVYIGYDHSLIDMDLLEETEKTWLKDYEAECEKRGTLFS